MSFHWVSLAVLLALGAAMTWCSPINSGSAAAQKRNFISDRLKLTHPEVGNEPLFSAVIRSINNSCQEITLMNATLDVYMRIFSSLLRHSHHQQRTALDLVPLADRDQVREVLENLKTKMSQLKTRLGHLHQNKQDLLSNINAIKVDDSLVQRKALAEFQEVYHAASLLLPRDSSH